jgi:hypothetical protein
VYLAFPVRHTDLETLRALALDDVLLVVVAETDAANVTRRMNVCPPEGACVVSPRPLAFQIGWRRMQA